MQLLDQVRDRRNALGQVLVLLSLQGVRKSYIFTLAHVMQADCVSSEAPCRHLLLLLECVLRAGRRSRKAQQPGLFAVVPGQVSMVLDLNCYSCSSPVAFCSVAFSLA